MLVAEKLSFNHPDDFDNLPAEFVGKWLEYEGAKSEGYKLKQEKNKAEAKSKKRR